jgi:hypothetical protein
MPSMHDAAFCEKLKALWLQTDPTLSCLEIGARLGLTVGQIVGLVRRRGWPHRPRVVPVRVVPPEPVVPVPEPPPPSVRAAPKPPPPPPATCQWPLWAHDERAPKPPRFCGAAVVPGLSYCREHERVCFIRPPRHRAEDGTSYVVRHSRLML